MTLEAELSIYTLLGILLFMVLSILALGLYLFLKPSRIPNIPYLDDNSLLGYTKNLSGAKSHENALLIAKQYPLYCQYRLLGQTIFMVNNPSLARTFLKDIPDKGDPIHSVLYTRSINYVRIHNTFNMAANEGWKLRRGKFRHAFAATSLKVFENELDQLMNKLCDVINYGIKLSTPIALDELFGKLAMDTISSVAFQYKMNALDDSPEFRAIHDTLRSAFEVNYLLYSYYSCISLHCL